METSEKIRLHLVTKTYCYSFRDSPGKIALEAKEVVGTFLDKNQAINRLRWLKKFGSKTDNFSIPVPDMCLEYIAYGLEIL